MLSRPNAAVPQVLLGAICRSVRGAMVLSSWQIAVVEDFYPLPGQAEREPWQLYHTCAVSL